LTPISTLLTWVHLTVSSVECAVYHLDTPSAPLPLVVGTNWPANSGRITWQQDGTEVTHMLVGATSSLRNVIIST